MFLRLREIGSLVKRNFYNSFLERLNTSHEFIIARNSTATGCTSLPPGIKIRNSVNAYACYIGTL